MSIFSHIAFKIFIIALLVSTELSAKDVQEFNLLVLPALITGALSNRADTPNTDQNSDIKPNASNTGVSLPLTRSSSVDVDVDGELIENLDIDGCLKVEANNVTIRNVRIDCGGFYGINIVSGTSGTIIEDVEVFGMQSSGVLGSNFNIRRANIHDSEGDAIKAGSNVVIENSWFHRLGSDPESHSDGVQMVSGNNVVIRGNNFDMPHDLTGFTNSQCMIIQTNNGPIDNVLIDSNWLNGGGYCVQINDKGNGYGGPTNVRITNNKFGRDCQFGILRFRDSSPIVLNNTWEDSGLPIGNDYTNCNNDLN